APTLGVRFSRLGEVHALPPPLPALVSRGLRWAVRRTRLRLDWLATRGFAAGSVDGETREVRGASEHQRSAATLAVAGQHARGRGGRLREPMALPGDRAKLVASYSHGMRKKLALSCALLHEPRLLFLDEPFEGIDAVATRELRDLLSKLVATRRMTVFLTSHVLEVVERLCTHVGIIVGGKLAAVGTLDELRRGPSGAPRSLEELFLHTVGAPRDGASAGLDWLTRTNEPA